MAEHNLVWIKEKLSNMYSGNLKDNLSRKLLITPLRNDYGKVGSYIFSLCGSPPKGHALWVHGHRRLVLISACLDKTRVIQNFSFDDDSLDKIREGRE